MCIVSINLFVEEERNFLVHGFSDLIALNEIERDCGEEKQQ